MYYSEWETYAYTARLRTARQKRRLLMKDRDKKLLKINLEFKKISEAKEELGFTELHPPIQKGWKRSFVLRHDVAASKDAEFFEGILKRINNKQFSHRKDFKKKRKRKGRKVYVEREQRLDHLEDWELYKKPLTEKEKRYFVEFWYQPWPGAQLKRRWIFTEPWRFVLKSEPHLLTHVRNIDPELEQQEDRLDQYLERHGLRPRYGKLVYGYYACRCHWNPQPKPKYKAVLKKTALQELEDRRFND